MKFYIDDLPVIFPYPKIYPEQYQYMSDIKRTLDAGGNSVLEMPSGTGKTVSLLSLCVAYQFHYKPHRKIVYCSRTMSEIEKALLELENLMAYRARELGYVEDFYGLGLTSRKNLCLNSKVRKEKNGAVVDEKCRRMTNGQARAKKEAGQVDVELCSFHEKMYEMEEYVPKGTYSFEKLIAHCEDVGICPYFTVRRMISQCNVIIYSYHYLLDPKISERVSREIEGDAIVIFDEAHNIDNVCIESLSMDVTNEMLKSAARGASALSGKIEEMKVQDNAKLQDEYERLVNGLRASDVAEELFIPSPVLPQDMLQEAIPGNIRRAEHFVSFLKRFISYLQTRMKALHVISETPTSFLQHLQSLTFIPPKPLRFVSERLSLLLRTLELSSLEDFMALKDIATFATLLSTYTTGFILILEPFELENATVPNPRLHLTCLDPSLAIAPIFEKFSSVVITSGTLSPLDIYPKLLSFPVFLSKSYSMTLSHPAFLPLVVAKGADQLPLSSRFEIRSDPSIVRNYATLVLEFTKITPDGLVVFFPSYLYMESTVSQWQTMGILDEIWKHKIILLETPDAQESALALSTFRKACSNGRGAVLFSVARGKVSEGIDFDHHFGRTVLLIGIPYQYTESRTLKARLEYLRAKCGIKEGDFLSFDAMRHAAQCLGRVVRGKDDYGVMVMADRRFARKTQQLPRWIRDGMSDGGNSSGISVDVGVSHARAFFRTCAQKKVIDGEKRVDVWSMQELEEYQRREKKGEGEGFVKDSEGDVEMN